MGSFYALDEIERNPKSGSREDTGAWPADLHFPLMLALQKNASSDHRIDWRNGTHVANNPRQKLSFIFTPGGVRVLPENSQMSGWTWSLSLVGCGDGENFYPMANADLIASDNRLDYRREKLTEWYLNGPLGLEQGFTVEEPLSPHARQEKLVLQLLLTGDLVPALTNNQQGLLLATPDGTPVLRYYHLYVYDAEGKRLPVRLQLMPFGNDTHLNIIVDTQDATYPVTVDPLIQEYTKLAEGAEGKWFGCSLSISGDRAVVGSSGAGTGGEAAYVFVRSGTEWTLEQTLVGDGLGGSDTRFGFAVAMDGDTIAVGAPNYGQTNENGAVFIYTRSGTTWGLQRKQLPPSPAGYDDWFGYAVALSGDILVVGFPSDDIGSNLGQGSAHIYVRSGTTWSLDQSLVRPDGQQADYFGYAVAIDGDTLVVSASRYPDTSDGTGKAYVYVYNGSDWVPQTSLQADDGEEGNHFGWSVAIENDTIAVGAPYDDNDNGTDAGAVYLFTRSGTTWSQDTKLVAHDGAANAHFGTSVSLNGNMLVVGSPDDDNPQGTDAGAVYFYARQNVAWFEQSKLIPGDDAAPDHFGCAVSFDGSSTAVGAQGTTITAGAAYLYPTGPGEHSNTGDAYCPLAEGEKSLGNPVGARRGEKREEVVDLQVSTPAGPLTLTRTYRLNKQTVYRFMGLGWTHNHQVALIQLVGTPNRIVIQLPNGGEAHFKETSTDHYAGLPGVNAVVDRDAASSTYTLVASDQSTYVFNDQGQLILRAWPNGESWTYDYDLSGRLSEVIDDASQGARTLIFRYYPTGHFWEGQLYRVGDQTFDDTDPLHPTGRYVEYSYGPNKSIDQGETIVDGPDFLLASVQDVRGKLWSYTYYGQDEGETDPLQLNFLIRRESPDLGGITGVITLEEITYTVQDTDLAVNGDMEEAGHWTPTGGATAQRVNNPAYVYSGSWSLEVDAGAEAGVEGDPWLLLAGTTYVITGRVYPVSGTVKMRLSDRVDPAQLSQGTGDWELLYGVVTPGWDAAGVQLQFVADNGSAHFYVDDVHIRQIHVTELVQERGNAAQSTQFAFQPGGENETTETVVDTALYQLVITHHFDNGVYAGPEDPAGNLAFQTLNPQYRPTARVDANGHRTRLAWSEDGQQLTQVTDAQDQETLFAYDNANRLITSTDADGRRTSYVYDGASRQPTLVIVGPEASEIALDGGMEEADSWTAIGTPTTNERFASQVDSGDYVRYVKADAVGEGIESVAWDLHAGQTYLLRARVYVVKGTVKMQVPEVAAFDVETIRTGTWETLTAMHTPSSTLTGRCLQFVAFALDSGEAEFYVDTVSLTVTGEVEVHGDMELPDPGSGWSNVGTPTTNERSSEEVDSGSYSRHVVTDAADEGVESVAWNLVAGQTYTIRAHVYPVGGVGNATVRMRLVDGSAQEIAASSDVSQDTDTWETLSCRYAPGTAMTGVRLQFLASGGAAQFYVDTVSIHLADEPLIHGDMEQEGYWTGISGSEPQINERRVRVDSGTYFRHVVVNAVDEGIESAAWNLTQDHTFLVMARVYVKKGAVKLQVPGVAALEVETGQTEVWETLRAIYEHSGSTSSKTLQFVATELEDGEADFYVDTVHLLDLGAMEGARKDQLRWQEFVYDHRGHILAEQVVNPEDAVLAQEVTRCYHATGPASGLLQEVVQKDQDNLSNITTNYTYDSVGRVVQTQRHNTFGSCEVSYTVYDAAGDVLASICNYDSGTHAPPTTAEEAAALYDDADPDKNQVTAYRYDDAGRRVEATANAGADHAVTTLTLYDTLSRVTRTITHYHPQGSSDPAAWVWVSDHWEDGNSNPVSHGADNTQNIIADTAYNQRGQVRLQRDVLGSVILYGYDAAGRQVKVVRSASVPDYNNDYAGTVPNQADPDLSNYSAVIAPARDIITTAEYDAAGNLIRSIDPLGNATLLVYDALNRLVKTVRSASDPDYDILNDPALENYTFSDAPDFDLVEQTFYESMGRVLYTQDVMGARTWYAYDTLDRRVKTIVNAQGTATDGGVNDPRSDLYAASDDPDKDLISRTHYDGQGRVQWTLDPIARRTWYVYDGLGRPVKTIANCTYDPENPQGVPPEDPGYTGSPDSDKDVISRTIYDTDGRVAQTIDGRGNAAYYAYDERGRQTLVVQNFYDDGNIDTDLGQWAWDSTDGRWEDGSGITIPHGDDLDRNLIAWTGYDLAGRVSATRDTTGRQTRFEYDGLGRRTRTITNYGDGTYNPAFPDEDLISQTIYNVAGQVAAAVDARGNQTSFEYDAAGRQVVVIQAAGTPLATKTYTCYDKARRVLRVISNWVEPEGANPPSPDDHDEAGNWVFAPNTHGRLNDENLITEYESDHLGRRVKTIDPVSSETTITYDQAGRVVSAEDPRGIATAYRYDDLGQTIRVVQNYQSQLAPWQIAFVSSRDGNNEVYVMNADGTCQTRLTAHSADDHEPAWSPDGRRLALVSDREGMSGLYVMEVDQPTPRYRAYVGETVVDLAWSPDGNRLVFTAWLAGKSIIRVINSDGSGLKSLTAGTQNNASPDWSPDGTKIVFSSTRDGTDEIYVMNADGTDQTRLTNNAVGDITPRWSPDGTQIVFVSWRDGSAPKIFVMAANGANPTRLIPDYPCYTPRWSPDGSRVVFDASGDVGVVDSDGSNLTYVSGGEGHDPRWSSDGSRVLFVSERDGNSEIYAVHPDGTNLVRLTNNTADDVSPAWSPVRRVVNPARWAWNASVVPPRWEDGWGQAVDHNAPANDRNVIATVEYDKAGRRTTLVDPRHNETGYEYDQINRRTALTDPLSHTWQTEYEDLAGGGSRITLADPAGHETERAFDRLGRLKTIDYLNENPKRTPDVTFAYDLAGNRAAMVEDDGAVNVRATSYGYDRARRLTRVDFDTDGDTDETVRYEYDAGGLRTRLILPGVGAPSVIYAYDVKGRLTGLTDWTSHTTTFTYDDADRPADAERANGLRSRYRYDAAGRLRLLRHTEGTRTLAYFAYEVDGRGNRTQALEVLAPPSGGGMVYAYNNPYIAYDGPWTDSAPYKVASSFSAALTLLFFGDTATLAIGTGPDHGLLDVYVNHSFWQSFDGYASASAERAIDIPLASVGPHLLEIRHRHAKNLASSGYTLRFKQLVTPNTTFIRYTYDALSRLQEARYNPASDLNAPDANLLRRYHYIYDLAGNRTQEIVHDGVAETKTDYQYNEANQIWRSRINEGVWNESYAYDNNGNLTGDGVNAYAWDRANRLLSVNNTAYQYGYNGLGSRVSQAVNSIVTNYLLDVQPGLVQVLAQTTGGSTSRFLIGPRGILAYENGTSDWCGVVQDGLGSVRVEVDDNLAVQATQHYGPYGVPFGTQGSFGLPFAFTGEMRDTNGLQYHRVRYLNPALGVFTTLDPVEGVIQQAMSLNRYGYAVGNPVNHIDPIGLCASDDSQCIQAAEDIEKKYSLANSPTVWFYWPGRIPTPSGLWDTPTPAPTATYTITPTTTATWTPTATATVTLTPTPTPTAAACPTPTNTPTITPSPTITLTPTATPIPTATPTATPGPTSTPVYALQYLYTPQAWTTAEILFIGDALALHGNRPHGSQMFNVVFVRAQDLPLNEGGRTIQGNQGLHPNGADVTILLGKFWSDHISSDAAYSRWLAVHELNHALLYQLQPPNYQRIGQDAVNAFVGPVVGEALLEVRPDARFPTEYACIRAGTFPEYLIEGMTAMIWNNTGSPNPATSPHIYERRATSPTLTDLYPYDVDTIQSIDGSNISLSDWIRKNVSVF